MIWWWHCFVVTNRGLTSPDPALTSNDKWRFCPTGIKRIKRHVIVLAWLRMQHLGVESWDVGLSSRRFYLSRNTLFSALPHPIPLAENLTRGPAASDDWLHTGQWRISLLKARGGGFCMKGQDLWERVGGCNKGIVGWWCCNPSVWMCILTLARPHPETETTLQIS